MTFPITCFFILLSLYVTTGARVHPSMHGALNQPRTLLSVANPDVVEKACAQSTEKELCVTTLKSQTISDVTDLKQAVLVVIKTAAIEATATSDLIKAARKREENKEVVEDGIEEETLADCNMSYISLMEIIEKATKALSAGSKPNVLEDVKAALTTAETCEKSIAGGRKSPMVEEVARKNEHVRKLCTNAISVYNVFAAAGHK